MSDLRKQILKNQMSQKPPVPKPKNNDSDSEDEEENKDQFHPDPNHE